MGLFDGINLKLPTENIFGSVIATKPITLSDVDPYPIKAGGWLANIPYAIKIEGLDPASKNEADNITSIDLDDGTFYFPINPESISINSPMAVTVTPTVGGIVEEHSGSVIFNISLKGTTGVLPGIDCRTGTTVTDSRPLASNTRISSGLLGGFGTNIIDTANGMMNNILGNKVPTADIKTTASGYEAYHVLYRTVNRYHQAKKLGSKVRMKFINFKDGNKYSVVVKNFNLTRDKSRPNLYNYSIEMIGWSISASDDADLPFLVEGDDRLAELGILEGNSIKAELNNTLERIKSTVKQAAGSMRALTGDLRF